MKKEELKQLIEEGHEIEFEYKNKNTLLHTAK